MDFKEFLNKYENKSIKELKWMGIINITKIIKRAIFEGTQSNTTILEAIQSVQIIKNCFDAIYEITGGDYFFYKSFFHQSELFKISEIIEDILESNSKEFAKKNGKTSKLYLINIEQKIKKVTQTT